MRKQRYMDQSIFICPVCNNQFPIMRNHGHHRERGHIKDIWCPFCKEDRKFQEVRRRDFVMTATGSIIYM